MTYPRGCVAAEAERLLLATASGLIRVSDGREGHKSPVNVFGSGNCSQVAPDY